MATSSSSSQEKRRADRSSTGGDAVEGGGGGGGAKRPRRLVLKHGPSPSPPAPPPAAPATDGKEEKAAAPPRPTLPKSPVAVKGKKAPRTRLGAVATTKAYKPETVAATAVDDFDIDWDATVNSISGYRVMSTRGSTRLTLKRPDGMVSSWSLRKGYWHPLGAPIRVANRAVIEFKKGPTVITLLPYTPVSPALSVSFPWKAIAKEAETKRIEDGLAEAWKRATLVDKDLPGATFGTCGGCWTKERWRMPCADRRCRRDLLFCYMCRQKCMCPIQWCRQHVPKDPDHPGFCETCVKGAARAARLMEKARVRAKGIPMCDNDGECKGIDRHSCTWCNKEIRKAMISSRRELLGADSAPLSSDDEGEGDGEGDRGDSDGANSDEEEEGNSSDDAEGEGDDKSCEGIDCDCTGEDCQPGRWKCRCGRRVCPVHTEWTKGSGSYKLCCHCEQTGDDSGDRCYCGEKSDDDDDDDDDDRNKEEKKETTPSPIDVVTAKVRARIANMTELAKADPKWLPGNMAAATSALKAVKATNAAKEKREPHCRACGHKLSVWRCHNEQCGNRFCINLGCPDSKDRYELIGTPIGASIDMAYCSIDCCPAAAS